jgi:hypothetical protein
VLVDLMGSKGGLAGSVEGRRGALGMHDAEEESILSSLAHRHIRTRLLDCSRREEWDRALSKRRFKPASWLLARKEASGEEGVAMLGSLIVVLIQKL